MNAPLVCQAMVQAQERLQKKVQGFMFNMGFSGYYYLTGDEQENEGDKKILGTDLVIWFMIIVGLWKSCVANKLTHRQSVTSFWTSIIKKKSRIFYLNFSEAFEATLRNDKCNYW